MRISRQQMFLEMAAIAAKRSTCFRANVGAVVVHQNRVVSIGYNGPPAGEEHCTGNSCAGAQSGCQRAIHAEINALLRIPGSLVDSLELYVTHSPCPDCASAICAFGRIPSVPQRSRVTRVYFRDLYRVNYHLSWFDEHGIELVQLTTAGYQINWETGEVSDGEVSLNR